MMHMDASPLNDEKEKQVGHEVPESISGRQFHQGLDKLPCSELLPQTFHHFHLWFRPDFQ